MKIGFLVDQLGAGREQDGSRLGTGRGINDEGWTMKDEGAGKQEACRTKKRIRWRLSRQF